MIGGWMTAALYGVMLTPIAANLVQIFWLKF
jgi:hypothetical protein